MRLPENVARATLGAAVMAIAAAIVAALFFVPIPEGNREVALVVLGIAIGWATAVVNFHFGSSEGSKQKTGILAGRKAEA